MAHEEKDEGGYGPHMKKVAWTILVMGVSLALVIFAWLWIGHIGPSYTAGVMQEQQKTLRDKYGLPSQETSTAELEVPPSLRGIEGASGSATSTAGNVTGGNAAGNATTVANQTAAGNQTTGNATSGNQTAGGNAMGAESGSALKVSIVSGAASKTNDAFNPNPVKAKAGDTVTWTSGDSTPHTATSGKGKPDGTFDSSILQPGKSFSFMFEKSGDYPYFCSLHPNMVGTVSVS